MNKKVTVVGAGNVGASCALMIAMQKLADVVLIDIAEGMAAGKALDMLQAAGPLGYQCHIQGGSDYALSAGSDVVVITAGLARKPGMDRLDLLTKNADIIEGITREAVKHSPDAVYIVVTNPIDVMVWLTREVSQLPAQRVVGQAGILDSSRYACFIAEALNVSVREINAMVLGGHGPTMVPLPRYTTVSGVPITELLDAETIEKLNDRTRHGGSEIVKLLETGSAYYAPAASTVLMVDSILNDTRHLLPCSVFLEGQYGIDGVYVGAPAVLGKNGVEKIVELQLTGDERKSLQDSAEVYKKSITELKAARG